MSAVTFRALLPDRGEVDADQLIASLDLGADAPTTRPYTVVNFVSTADGRVTFRGRSGPIGDEGDRAMFHALRERMDAVMAGTGTLRAERYGRILGKAERRRRRQSVGLSPEPLACVVTRSGELPLDIPLFAEPDARIVVFSPRQLALDGVQATVHVEAYDPTSPNPLTHVLRRLRERYEIRSLLCEGGPSLFGSLLAERLVDELFLTIAPKLAGGGAGPAAATGEPLPDLADLHIRWLLERDHSLYLRYGLS